MTRDGTYLALIFIVFIALLLAYRLYLFNVRPFDLEAFLDLALRRNEVVAFTPRAMDMLDRFEVRINKQYVKSNRYTLIQSYFIDTDRIESDFWFPLTWKRYTRSFFANNGTAFLVQRVIIVDGSMLNSHRRAGIKASSEGVLAIYAHELAHLCFTEARSPPEKAESEYEAAAQALLAGKTAVAEAKFRAALALYPWYFEALDELARICTHSGRVAEAIHLYEQSLEIEPEGSVALNNLVDILALTRRNDQAMHWVDILIAAHPKSAEGPYWKGYLLLAEKRPAEAVDWLERAGELYRSAHSPLVGDADILRFRALSLVGRSKEADQLLPEMEETCRLDTSERWPECSVIRSAGGGLGR